MRRANRKKAELTILQQLGADRHVLLEQGS
jgi:hypothetical protein